MRTMMIRRISEIVDNLIYFFVKESSPGNTFGGGKCNDLLTSKPNKYQQLSRQASNQLP